MTDERPGTTGDPYFIVGDARSGSTYLASHMQAHPQIVSRYEILGRRSTSWERQFELLQARQRLDRQAGDVK